MSKLYHFLFVLFSGVIGSFVAMLLSRFFIPKSSGLAGGVEVLAYGLFGFIGGIVLALVLKKHLPPEKMKPLTYIFGTASLAIIFWLIVKFNTNRSPVDTPRAPKLETTAPARM